MPRRILICDDDEDIRSLIASNLEPQGDEVVLADCGERAVESVNEVRPDVVLLDLHMPGMGGIATLQRLSEGEDAPPVIVMTSDGQMETALQAAKLGAVAYLTKPLNFDELFMQVDAALEHQELKRELAVLRARGYGKLIGASPAMAKLFSTLTQLETVATPTVLIRGESGTGKDLIAQAIHNQGARAGKPFMEIDCASLPEHLIEAELFGYERGAFTDAHKDKPGLLEVAGAGTVFLDEIGEMPIGTQAKLLRALENRTFKRVGGLRALPFRAAVIAATNRDLDAEVAAGRFREDLFFRLNVVPVKVPPLRERPEDIPALTHHFLTRFNRELNKSFTEASPQCLEVLQSYPWPGNVRELRNLIERVAILEPGNGMLQASQLPPEVRFAPVADEARPFVLPEAGVDLEWLERDLVQQAMDRTGGARKRAAELLGITRHALRYRLQKLNGKSDAEA